jgi:SAM-dependent methyltransferase
LFPFFVYFNGNIRKQRKKHIDPLTMQQEKPDREIKPITMPGIHESVYRYIKSFLDRPDEMYILDAGAGHGAFSKLLHDHGFNVSACDQFPGEFYFDAIECRQADITRKLPYEDGSFDVVLLIEVMEHIHDHKTLFLECYRVLKENGIMFFSTPNIMSLKSRIRFLLNGFFYAFKPLDYERSDGRQHIASLTIDQYTYLAVQSGFPDIEIAIDKKQRSSRWLAFLIPLIWISCRTRRIPFRLHNRYRYLTGRLLFFTLRK